MTRNEFLFKKSLWTEVPRPFGPEDIIGEMVSLHIDHEVHYPAVQKMWTVVTDLVRIEVSDD